MKYPALTVAFALGLLASAPRAQCPPIQTEIPQISTTTDIYFGSAMAVDDQTVILGASHDDEGAAIEVGSVQIHKRGANGTVLKGVRIVPSSAAAASQLHFGGSVAVAGADAIAGAVGDSQGGLASGAAYLLHRVSVLGKPTWVLGAKIKGSNNQAFGRFGQTVAMAPGVAVISAPGNSEVYVFEDNGAGQWVETAVLTPPPIYPSSWFGIDLVTDGTNIFVGAINNGPPHGAVHRYIRSGNTWVHLTRIQSPQQTNAFGESLALDWPRLYVGDQSPSAAVYVYNGHVAAGSIQLGQLNPGNTVLDVAANDGGIVVGLSGIDQLRLYSDPAFEEVLRTHNPAGSGEVQYGISVAAADDVAVVGFWRGSKVVMLDTSARCAPYCSPGLSASGCQATLSTSGTPSASAPSGFTLSAGAVEGNKDGLFFFGTNGRQASPWGNGTSLQCVVPPVSRGGLLAASGTPGACDGSFAQDLNALWQAKPPKNPGAGAVVQAQLWYRDPLNTSNQTTGLSNAFEFSVGP